MSDNSETMIDQLEQLANEAGCPSWWDGKGCDALDKGRMHTGTLAARHGT